MVDRRNFMKLGALGATSLSVPGTYAASEKTMYLTGNPIGPDGSNDPRDLSDTARIADVIVNDRSRMEVKSRLGVPLKTRAGMEQMVVDYLAAQGYESVHLVYTPGQSLVVQRPTQLIDYNGSVYRVKMPATFPVNLTGTWENDAPRLTDVGDAALRQALGSLDEGANMVARSVVVFSTFAELSAVPLGSRLTDKIYRVNGLMYRWDGLKFSGIAPRQADGSWRRSLRGRRYSTAQIYGEISYHPASVLFARQATSMQFVELIFPVASGQAAVVDFEVEASTSDIGAADTFAVHAGVSRCTNADRAGAVVITSATVAVDGNRIRVTVPSAQVTLAYLAVSLRVNAGTDARVRVMSMSARHGNKLLARDMFNIFPAPANWSSVAANVKLPTALGDVNSRVQLSAGAEPGTFYGPSRVDVAPGGSSDGTFPPYSMSFYADSIHGKNYARRVALAPGDYNFSRRSFALSATEDVTLVCAGGRARIFGGRELPTSSWTLFTDGAVRYYSAPYDWTTNPDAAIRAGTRQPFVTYRIPENRDDSILKYNSTPVASISAVRNTPRAHFYDHASKTLYFSEGGDLGTSTAFIYITEMDYAIGSNTQVNVRAAGIDCLACKTDGWYFRRPGGYVPLDSGGSFVALHGCGSYANLSMGTTINNVDYELIDFNAASNTVDGMNFHFEGVGYIDGGSSKNNGDDGVSHHENTLGWMRNVSLRYNGAGNSTPAFGARVLHQNCESVPARLASLSAKPYSGTMAVLSGQSSGATGIFEDCYTEPVGDGRAMYTANAQAAGTAATVIIRNASSPADVDPLYSESGPGVSSVSVK